MSKHIISLIIGVVAGILSSIILKCLPLINVLGLNKYLIPVVIGVVAGVLSVLALKYLPVMRELFNLIDGLHKCKITGVWKNRDESEAKEAIKKELEKAKGEIFMAGVAFPDFFRPKAEYAREIQALFGNPTIKFRILLLDYDKEHAHERDKIEKGRFTIRDIKSTIEYFLKTINVQADIEVKTYDFPPIAFLVLTEKCVFIEQYHLGTRRTKLGCIGGQTPLLRMDASSITYGIMKEHFNYIWENKSQPISRPHIS